MNQNNEMTEKKVIIVGLENSGKTSILLSLKEDTNLLSYTSLKPTRGVNIDTVESEESSLVIWDLGGQEKYRNDHLNRFQKYLYGSQSLIFIIDVQDQEKYNQALEYLRKIIKELKKEPLSIKISIFLHKYDPNLSFQPKFKDIDTIVEERLIKVIDEIMPSELDCRIFKTSIYTVFEKMLIK